MKKKRLSNKTIALFAAAAILFAGGGYTATKAVLNIYSPEHFLQFDTDDQLVQILENGAPSSTLLTSIEGNIFPGRENREVISAKNNSKESPQFVRIVIRKYWVKDGKKQNKEPEDPNEFFPDLDVIKLQITNDSRWQENVEERTAERRVYYYKNVVGPQDSTAPLTSALILDKSVAENPHVSGPVNNIYTYTYDYDGYTVYLEAEAQSIQTHNANKDVNPIKSIWGVTNVTATETTLTVN